jgi:hypothetical protein
LAFIATALAGVFFAGAAIVLTDLAGFDLSGGFADRADFAPDAGFFDAAFATTEPRSFRTTAADRSTQHILRT